MDEILSRQEAAAFAKLPDSTFRALAKKYNLSHSQAGRRRLYKKSDLVKFINQMQNRPAASAEVEDKKCQSSFEVQFGGAISQRQMEKELSALLAQK